MQAYPGKYCRINKRCVRGARQRSIGAHEAAFARSSIEGGRGEVCSLPDRAPRRSNLKRLREFIRTKRSRAPGIYAHARPDFAKRRATSAARAFAPFGPVIEAEVVYFAAEGIAVNAECNGSFGMISVIPFQHLLYELLFKF